MRLIDVRRQEWAPLAWAAGWFFCVLASYYAIRPVRDAFGVDAGPDGLRWLFTATFVAMIVVAPLYGLLTTVVARHWLPAMVYGFFALNLIGFWVALTAGAAADVADDGGWVRWLFYVWVSVFNLYSTTLFWSVAVDRFSDDQAKRLFGVMASAGTLGGLFGSEAARWIVREAGVEEVLWLSAGLLMAAIGCAWRFRLVAMAGEVELSADLPAKQPLGRELGAERQAAGGGENLRAAVAGLVDVVRSPYLAGIAALMLLTSIVATSIYMEMSDLVGQQISSSSARTDWYARLNNYQNLLTLVGQLLGASWLIRTWGLGATLVIVPAVYAVGFAAIAMHPTLALLGALDVAQRVASFVIGVPAREVLFTPVSSDQKYRAKAVIDTVGKRAGDAAAAHGYAALRAIQWTPSMISLAMLPLTAVIAGLSVALGRRHAKHVKSARNGSFLSPPLEGEG